MKRFSIIVLIICLILLSVSCTNNNKTEEKTDISSQSVSSSSPENNSNETITTSSSEYGGGSLDLTKYRSIYCDIPRPFINLVDVFEFQDWFDEIIKDDPNDTNIMVMKLFVQKFNISREQFDRANLEWAKIIIKGFKSDPVMNPQDFSNQEINEVYNADIIYTFDDEIINNYYLSHEYPFLYELEYENAVENGTYETRTIDWVDVDQMEAEINAKYGAPESTDAAD